MKNKRLMAFSKGSLSFRGGKMSYEAPRVTMEAEAVLEDCLLNPTSIFYSIDVETAGQANDGYYSNGQIVTGSNYWGD